MTLIDYLHTALVLRLAELRGTDERDRGESPVPTAVIIFGLVLAALAVTLSWQTRSIFGWTRSPTEVN